MRAQRQKISMRLWAKAQQQKISMRVTKCKTEEALKYSAAMLSRDWPGDQHRPLAHLPQLLSLLAPLPQQARNQGRQRKL
jgi:hypothetical protein